MREMEPREDLSEDLARTLGMEVLDFIELFGAGWIENAGPVWHDFDSDPSGGEGYEVTPWMIAGEPPQLMIRVFDHGVFIAEPEGEWRGSHDLTYRPGMQRYLGREEFSTRAVAATAEMLRRRRRTFRYCRHCRSLTPPELRADKDLCMGCESSWFGVVY